MKTKNKNDIGRLFQKNTIAGRMRLIMFGILLILAISFTVSVTSIRLRAMRDQEIKSSEAVINGIINSVQSNIDNYKDLSRLVMLNDMVIKYLRATAVDKGLANDAKSGVWNVLNVCKNVDSVYIIRNDGTYMSTGRGEYLVDTKMMDTQEWKEKILSKRGGVVFGMYGNGAIHRNNQAPIMSISRAIYDIYTQQQTGILIMNISNLLVERLVSGQPGAQICILDNEGNYLAGDKALTQYYSLELCKNEITHKQIKSYGESSMVSGYAFDEIPWVILCRTQASQNSDISENQVLLFFIFLSFIVAIILASMFISYSITGPILQLSSAMEETQNKGWMERINVKMPNNEIGMLADNYNSMIDYLNNLFTRLIDKEKSVQKAEMSILYEQIKPHFLYNSLETISFMALDAGAKNVHEALETLGSFYRNFLSKGDRVISLRRELSIVKDYLSLQKLRYSEIFEDQYDVTDEALECTIPKLLLQPLVENSIYHGIRLKGEPGIIRISARVDNDVLLIEVYDNGVGMDENQVQRLLSGERKDDVTKEIGNHSDFGLRGTLERVKFFCNNENVVDIKSVQGEYTSIILKILLSKPEREN